MLTLNHSAAERRYSYLSAVERGEKEIGAEALLRISREFGKPLEWLLTGND